MFKRSMTASRSSVSVIIYNIQIRGIRRLENTGCVACDLDA